MCPPKVPKPPKPPPPPSRPDAEMEADKVRRRIAQRRGAADAIKTTPAGAVDFGQNTQFTGLSAGKQTTLGVGQ